MLKRLLQRLRMTPGKLLRKFRGNGGVVGVDCRIYSPETVHLDMGRAYLIRIGDHCKITGGVTILAHDFARTVAQEAIGYKYCLGGSAPVNIGNNCFLGMGATILMGTNIGNNCIVGAGSVVKGNFPDNVVIGGNPAKVICTLEEYYERRMEKVLDEAVACVAQIYRNTGKLPTWKQMGEGFAWLYTHRNEKTLSSKMPPHIRNEVMNTKAQFGSFQEFLDYACEKAEIPKK